MESTIAGRGWRLSADRWRLIQYSLFPRRGWRAGQIGSGDRPLIRRSNLATAMQLAKDTRPASRYSGKPYRPVLVAGEAARRGAARPAVHYRLAARFRRASKVLRRATSPPREMGGYRNDLPAPPIFQYPAAGPRNSPNAPPRRRTLLRSTAFFSGPVLLRAIFRAHVAAGGPPTEIRQGRIRTSERSVSVTHCCKRLVTILILEPAPHAARRSWRPH
jgi:hypothetical protein